MLEPSFSSSGLAEAAGRTTPRARAQTGAANEVLAGAARRPRSSTARTASCPTLRKVAISLRLASPMITWRRRYFWASACGSSRVLTIGRLRVVSRPTSSSKNSARWVSWNGTSSRPRPPSLGAHLARAGEDLAGDEVRGDVGDDAPERHRPVHQVVLVAAVGVALAVGVVLVDHDLLALGQDALGGHHGPLEDLLGGPVPHDDRPGVGALGRRQLGVGVVDVEAGAVGEHRVDQVGLDLGGHRAVGAEPAGVVGRATRPRSPTRPSACPGAPTRSRLCT